MLGLSMKEKLAKSIISISQNKVSEYEEEIENNIEKFKTETMEEFDFIYNQFQKRYYDSISEEIESALRASSPTISKRISIVLHNPSLCGFDDIKTENGLSASFLYAICYFASTNKKALPSDCINLYKTQTDIMKKGYRRAYQVFVNNMQKDENSTEFINNKYSEDVLKTFSKEKQDKITELKHCEQQIQLLKSTLSKAIKDLGDTTIDDVEKMFSDRKITMAQKDESVNSIETLKLIINSYPKMINTLETQKKQLVIAIETSDGYGTYTYSSGNKYVGEFKDKKRDGQGTITYVNGDEYSGEFVNNLRSGNGTFTRANGDIYVGEYKDDEPNGQGTMTYTYGDKYVGEFKEGNFNGIGKMTFANGDIYEGEYKDNRPNGQGTYTFTSGDKHVGIFKDGIPNGQGTYTFTDGDILVGEFKDGEFIGQGDLT